jgi:hypothetical protein
VKSSCGYDTGIIGNLGKGMSAVGSRYQVTGERQQTMRTQCVHIKLRTGLAKWQ